MMRSMRESIPAMMSFPQRPAALRRCAGGLLRWTAALLALVAVPAMAAAPAVAPVYKCPQAGSTVLYADYPCKGGAEVDIRPGVAAPDATERLARARSEIDRAAARREALEAAADIRRRELDWQLAASQGGDAAMYSPDVAYIPAYGYTTPYLTAGARRSNLRPHHDVSRSADRRMPAIIRRP